MEAMLWMSILRRANQGEPEAVEMLQSENEIRRGSNLPTVEQELREMAELATEKEEIYNLLKNGQRVVKPQK